MKAHPFQPATGAALCVCGKNWWNEEHFGDDRLAAKDAYVEWQRELVELAREVTLGTRVRVRWHVPQARLANLTGFVTYVERHSGMDGRPNGNGFCTVQFDPTEADEAPLPTNVNFAYLARIPLEVPTFASQEEADAWLEAHNPVPEPPRGGIPRFQCQEEADRWLANQDAKEDYLHAALAAEQERVLKEHDARLSQIIAKAATDYKVTTTLTQEELRAAMGKISRDPSPAYFHGPAADLVILDEAVAFTPSDTVTFNPGSFTISEV